LALNKIENQRGKQSGGGKAKWTRLLRTGGDSGRSARVNIRAAVKEKRAQVCGQHKQDVKYDCFHFNSKHGYNRSTKFTVISLSYDY
jgi:hypothetical protein